VVQFLGATSEFKRFATNAAHPLEPDFPKWHAKDLLCGCFALSFRQTGAANCAKGLCL
jgi:hypothetical protein